MADLREGTSTLRSPPARSGLLLPIVVGLYVALVVVVAALLRFEGDRWWPATLILFGPRWILALPLTVLVPIALFARRWLLVPLGLAGLLVLFPILDLRVPLPGAAPAQGAAKIRLRVMTYNVGGGPQDGAGLLRIVRELSPDVVAVQECFGGQIAEALREQAGEPYSLRALGDVCVLSRLPVDVDGTLDAEAIRGIGGTGSVARYTVHARGGDLHLVNAHLATVREGLDAVLSRHLDGIPELEKNFVTRDAMSTLARAFVDATPGPTLIVGDFNMPIDSAIYRRVWSPFPNAFSEVGSGFGTTKATRWFGMRIDHVLLGPGWSCERAFVGPNIGGDHRPVIADLTWSG